jgi:hypothetical protein
VFLEYNGHPERLPSFTLFPFFPAFQIQTSTPFPFFAAFQIQISSLSKKKIKPLRLQLRRLAPYGGQRSRFAGG